LSKARLTFNQVCFTLHDITIDAGQQMQKTSTPFMISFISQMVAYAIVLIASEWLIKQVQIANPVRYAIAVIPVIPLLFALAAFLKMLQRMDEMQLRIHVEAFGISLAITGFATFTLGLLENVGIPSPGIIWVFPMMIIVWGIAAFFVSLRYQ